jgi:hypothetical protein
MIFDRMVKNHEGAVAMRGAHWNFWAVAYKFRA